VLRVGRTNFVEDGDTFGGSVIGVGPLPGSETLAPEVEGHLGEDPLRSICLPMLVTHTVPGLLGEDQFQGARLCSEHRRGFERARLRGKERLRRDVREKT